MILNIIPLNGPIKATSQGKFKKLFIDQNKRGASTRIILNTLRSKSDSATFSKVSIKTVNESEGNFISEGFALKEYIDNTKIKIKTKKAHRITLRSIVL